jgi:general secretion pathway protein G
MSKVEEEPRATRGVTPRAVLMMVAIVPLAVVVLWQSGVRIPPPNGYLASARTQINMLKDAASHYVLEVGSAPTTQQGLAALMVAPAELADPTKWKGPYLEKVQLPVDPWNSSYQYKALSGSNFRIWSAGPDRISGTKDDISTDQFP